MGILPASSRSRALIAFVASYPFITGIWTSIKIASNSPGAASLKRSKAIFPFSTTSKAAPSISRISSRISALISLSSAARKRRPSKLLSVSASVLPFSPFFSCSSIIRSLSADTKNGFARMPIFSSLWTSSIPSISWDVNRKIGAVSGIIALIFSAVRIPSISGISQSIKTTWYPSPSFCLVWIWSMASFTLNALSTQTPISPISVCIFSQNSGSLSTARIREIPLFSQNFLSACPSGIRNSKSTLKIVPLFTSLETSMVPPISSTIFFVIAIPKPVPWTLLVVLFSALVKASKTVVRNWGVIPYPSSSTSIRRCSYWLERCFSPIIRNQILPFSGVYFTALERRLIKIWLILVTSPIRFSCFTPVTSTWKCWSFTFDIGRIMASTEDTRSFKVNSSIFRTTFPLSIFDTSKISFIKLSRCWPDAMIFFVYSLTLSGFSASLARRVVNPKTAFMGVRISWDILERNIVLELFAIWAACKASASCLL